MFVPVVCKELWILVLPFKKKNFSSSLLPVIHLRTCFATINPFSCCWHILSVVFVGAAKVSIPCTSWQLNFSSVQSESPTNQWSSFYNIRSRYKSPCNCINAEDNTANCWIKVITVIRRILVVLVLKTATFRHNISSGSRLLAKIKLALVSYGSSNQPSTGLAYLM